MGWGFFSLSFVVSFKRACTTFCWHVQHFIWGQSSRASGHGYHGSVLAGSSGVFLAGDLGLLEGRALPVVAISIHVTG